jgi:cyclopropane fatty-acyl-phospholipid synthase-like methyltransferase
MEKPDLKGDLSIKIGEYYDSNLRVFDSVFGNLTQVFQPIPEKEWLQFQMEQIDIGLGNQVLDAGCGNCIPAIYFAQNNDCHITAITISDCQEKISKVNITAAGLNKKIEIRKADYNQITKIFPSNYFDIIYFLESIGHSDDKRSLLQKIKSVLKHNGSIYIQDLFYDPGYSSGAIDKIKSIKYQSHYFVEEISEFLQICVDEGFLIESCINLSVKFADSINYKINKLEQQTSGSYKDLKDAYCSYIFGIKLQLND